MAKVINMFGEKEECKSVDGYLNEAIGIIKDAIPKEKERKIRKGKQAKTKETLSQTINGDGNTQIGGNFTQNIYASSGKKVTVAPPSDTIGSDSMLKDRIKTLMDELGMRRKERFGDDAFKVMYARFKKDFKIPSKKAWTCIWLWKKSRADEIIQYFEEKLGNTIQGRIEGAANRPGYRHSRKHLFAKERKIIDELGLKSDDPVIRDCMKKYFGVVSRRDLGDEQLANWVAFLEQEAEKAYQSKQ